jgi:hypothetical protein
MRKAMSRQTPRHGGSNRKLGALSHRSKRSIRQAKTKAYTQTANKAAKEAPKAPHTYQAGNPAKTIKNSNSNNAKTINHLVSS